MFIEHLSEFTSQAPLGAQCVALLKERIKSKRRFVTINIAPLAGLCPSRLVGSERGVSRCILFWLFDFAAKLSRDVYSG